MTTPLGTTTYKHVGYGTIGAGSTWQVGLLMERAHKSLSSAPLQTETFTWDKQQISTYPTIRAFGLNDGVTYAPLQVSRAVNRNGITFTTTNSNFDAYGNPQTTVEVGGRTRTVTRTYLNDTAKWIIGVAKDETVAGVGDIWRTFDPKANLTNETRFGVSSAFFYGDDGTVTSKTDANGKTTTYLAYMRGTPQQEQRPASITILRTVDSNGDVTAQTDGAGNNYTYVYDGIRRMTRKTPPVGAITNVAWTASISRTAARGTYVESAVFDGMANPYLVTRAGIPTLSAVDPFLRKNFESLPGGFTQVDPENFTATGTTAYRDLIGRVTNITNPDTTRRTLSHVGGSTTERDERLYSTVYQYWAFGEPDKRFLFRIGLPNANDLTIGRDNLGNITSVAQGTVTRTYGYNGSYFLTSMTEPETGTTTFGRDAVGNMMSRTIGGKTTNFSYDGINRLTGIAYPGGSTVGITYLGNGRTASVTNGQAARIYSYDPNANLLSETLTVGAQSFTVTYTYDANDALATLTYPRTGEVVTYAPDSLGRPTSATPYVTAIAYFASGNPQKISYANGTDFTMEETTRQWPRNLLAQKADQSQPELANKRYDYDPTGNVLQSYEGDSSAPRELLQMTYDNINQLKTVAGPWQTSVIDYDAVGNITRYDGFAGSYVYGADNKLNSVNSSAVQYDVYGNMTSLGSHTYQYDDASNLICADCGTANQINYAYDGNNRRVSRSKGSETTYYVHASSGDLLLEYTVPSNVAIQHIYLHGKRIASKRVQL